MTISKGHLANLEAVSGRFKFLAQVTSIQGHQEDAGIHKVVFTHRNFLHTKAFTQRSLCTEAPLHEVTSWNWQQLFGTNSWQQLFGTNSWQELSGTHLLPKKAVYFQQSSYSVNFFKKHMEYISEAGPHPKAFKPTLRWNGGSRNPAEPTRGVSP